MSGAAAYGQEWRPDDFLSDGTAHDERDEDLGDFPCIECTTEMEPVKGAPLMRCPKCGATEIL